MIVVKSSKILDAVLAEAAELKAPTLLTIKKLTKLREFPGMVNISDISPHSAGAINYMSNIGQAAIPYDHRRYCKMASMLEDMNGTEISFADKDNNALTVARRYTDFTDDLKPFANIKNRTFLIENKRYETTNPESTGFIEGDVLAVYEIRSGNSKAYVRRTLDRNASMHGRNYYVRYGHDPVIDNVKQYYYDQVFVCSSSLGPQYSWSYERDIEDSFKKAWSKYKSTVVNSLRKNVQKEDLDDYVAESKCHRTQAVMDLSFKISALEDALACYKKELHGPGSDMGRLKDYASAIYRHTKALKTLNYTNRNVLGNRVMNVPGGKITIEKLLAKK